MELDLKVYLDTTDYSCELCDQGGNTEEPTIRVDILSIAQRIRNMRTLCRDHDLANVSIWCYVPCWDDVACDGDAVRSDCEQLHVSKDEFWFDTYIKNTTLKIATEHINVSMLKAMGI